MNTVAKTAEILFLKSVKDGIPNRDPLQDGDARRLFGIDDGRISLSDVSIKRDVRDYVLSKYKDNNQDKAHYIWCREEHGREKENKNKLLGRNSSLKRIYQIAGLDYGKNGENASKELSEQLCYDMRVFGSVFSVSKNSFHQVGPVQFGWAHSLHPVTTTFVQGTTVLPSKDIEIRAESAIIPTSTATEDKSVGDGLLTVDSSTDDAGATESSAEGKTQGTIWTSFFLPFAVFAMPGVINQSIAKETGMTEEDANLLCEALWKGTLMRQARGRGFQQPELLMCVEYNDPFFRIGHLEDGLKLSPVPPKEWSGGQSPTSIQDVRLDISTLLDRLDEFKGKIKTIRYWQDPDLQLTGTNDSFKSGKQTVF